MKIRMQALICCCATLLLPVSVPAQSNGSRQILTDIAAGSLPPGGKQQIVPVFARTLVLDRTAVDGLLAGVPMEGAPAAGGPPVLLELPLPGGSFSTFRIEESPVMAPELAARFPEIRTYAGTAIDDRAWSARFDVTPAGFHAMIFTPEGTVFIDPLRTGDVEHYICYFRRDLPPDETRRFLCEGALDELGSAADIERRLALGVKLSGSQLRTYRLAVATTGEYTAFHGGTVTAGLAAVVTAVNRVVGVYEKEVAVRMLLVANNDLLIYTDAGSDPYANNSGTTMLGQNQTTIDGVIGTGNYDIGHVFSTGGGGVAGLGVVCRAGNKARGVTGQSSPIGDPFSIDYVAHEMGHQFGGNHTFNGTAGSCGGNRSASNAYEPGSGTTIMAYAGICGTHNTQGNSDAYFHGRSIDEIVAYTTAGSGNGCPVITATGNSEPVVGVPPGGFAIPKSTPFVLTGSATDPEGDALTYCWEEFDLGPGGDPNAPTGNAPLFRSFLALATPSRMFPRLSNVLNNTQTIGELLPSYARTLTFRLTARDNRSGGGGVGKATMSFSVTDSAGPFLVTFPNTGVSLVGGGTTTVTWNVAGTNLSPVLCDSVNILLSTNGGNTFPTVLAAGTPNDGSEPVLLPGLATTAARIRVEAADNIFFDLSNTNFAITALGAPPLLQPAVDAVEDPAGVVLVWRAVSGANDYGVQVATEPAFGSGLVVSDSLLTDTTYTVSGLDSSRTYFWRVRGTNAGGPGGWSSTRRFYTSGPTPSAPLLVTPAADTLVHAESLLVAWRASQPGVLRYWLEWSTDSLFTVSLSDSSLTDTLRLVRQLQDSSAYYYRVRAKNILGWGPASEIGRFSTLFTIQACVPLANSWNMIAVPVRASGDSLGVLFLPCSGGCAFRYLPGTGYLETCLLEPGVGYWAKCTAGQACITGVEIAGDTIPVVSGWNLVGSLSVPLSTALVTSEPAGIIDSPFFTFGPGGYLQAATLLPGAGYWVRVSQAGTIFLHAAPTGLREPNARSRSSF